MINDSHKTRITLIALITVAVFSLFFLVLKEVTTLYWIAYSFALLGIAWAWWSGISLVDDAEIYPWGVAMPVTALRYLYLEVLFSVVFVLLEQLSLYKLPPKWFFLIHALILAFFSVRLIFLKSGVEVIERRETQVREKVFNLRALNTDLMTILGSASESARDIQPVIDALRYSDPMSHASLASFDDKIRDSVNRLRQAVERRDTNETASLCAALLYQIKDRNNRVKLMK